MGRKTIIIPTQSLQWADSSIGADRRRANPDRIHLVFLCFSNAILTKIVYIKCADTCPPCLLVLTGVSHRVELSARPPRVVLPVALLRLPGVSPPRPAILLILGSRFNTSSVRSSEGTASATNSTITLVDGIQHLLGGQTGRDFQGRSWIGRPGRLPGANAAPQNRRLAGKRHR